MVNTYDNYYEAIDAEGVGATVKIGDKIVKAVTADGYTGKSNNNSGGGNNTVDKITSTVSNAASAVSTGISNLGSDIKMGAYDLFLDDAGMIKEFGQEAFDNYRAATEVTSKINKAVAAGDPSSLKDENGNWLDASYENRYNHMVNMNKDGGGSSEMSEVTGLDVDGDGDASGSESVADLTIAEQILQWAKESGVLQKQEDIKAILADPIKWMSDNKFDLKSAIPTLDADAEGTAIDGSADKFKLDDVSLDPATVDINDLDTVDEVTVPTPVSYDVTSAASGLTDDMMVDAVTGEVSKTVNAEEYTVDLKGKATGINADGSVDYTGKALNNWAAQDFSNIIDTSTPAGRELARQLGEGNYTDKRATTAGQIEILTKQFVNDQGEYVIPVWARGLAKSVNGSLNMTGAATDAAMAQAIMASVIQIADKDAKFFQDLTIKNLSNRQAAIINKATVLANFDTANMNARQTAAVENAKAFLQMDLKNLTNEQQAEVINKGARVTALFDDVKAINAEKAFEAGNINDFNKFYSELNVAIQRHNTAEINALKKFNAGEINDAAQFVLDIQNSREQFYNTMQYNIDRFNAGWRQEITMKEFDTVWDATTTDVKNSLGLTTELHNRIWDDADAMLDMIAKMSEGEQNRILELTKAQIQAQAGRKGGTSFLGGLLSLGSAFLSSSTGAKIFAKAIGIPI